jgi:TrmH family RNA methyltransferase
MLARKITSLQHPLVKKWVSLRSDKRYREENQRLLIVGKNQIEELASEIEIHSLITLAPSELAAKEHFIVDEPILKKITGLHAPDGFAAEVSVPKPIDLSHKKYLLVLDKIADPGNLGTLLRTAYALKWDGVIVTPNTVDLFNDKALRAGKGAIFRLPYAKLDQIEILSLIQERKFHSYTADTKGDPVGKCEFKEPLLLILSSEAKGPSIWPNMKKITIPMQKKAESLNVAASGAILLYLMRQPS